MESNSAGLSLKDEPKLYKIVSEEREKAMSGCSTCIHRRVCAERHKNNYTDLVQKIAQFDEIMRLEDLFDITISCKEYMGDYHEHVKKKEKEITR